MNIGSIGVVGAGTMGNGIAQVCAAAGINVVMVDIDEHAIERGKASIAASLGRLVKKEVLTVAASDEIVARIKGATEYTSMADCDLVIEAATENLALKRQILERIGSVVRKDAVVATNTSSLSVTELASAIGNPSRFVGLHFFNPVPVMALVEVIVGIQTSDATREAAQAFVAALGKTAIIAKNSPGFVVNRILCPMINEAVFALQEGLASAEDIDTGMRLGCNQPIGPLALADLIGLDTMLSVMQSFYRDFGDPKYRPAPLLRDMVAAGHLGRKSGRGFFVYK